ncbi:MAG TPA: META domain-containing protein [Dehalococcoidales bacterium]
MRTKLFVVLVLMLTISLLLGACTKTTGGDGEWQDILWTLESYGPPDNLQSVLRNANITLRFDSNFKQAVGSGGCNHYFGSYTIKSNCGLQISGLGATEMACKDSVLMQQEQRYFGMLQDADKIEVKDGELRITCGTEVLVYIH